MDEFFARNRLSAYLDGELGPAETREIELALEKSATLRAEYEELKRVVGLLHRAGPLTAPAGFAERLEARLSREKLVPGWRRHLPRVRMEVAMLAAAAVVVLVVSGRKPETEPAPAAEAPPPPVAEPAPPVAVAVETPAPPAAAPSTANGVLGDESLARKSKGSPKSTSKRADPVEKEPYNPEWEKQEKVPSVAAYTAPVQYRLRPFRGTSLKELQAVAAELGGTLLDSKGNPLAPYPMNEGETRVVTLEIPQFNAPGVARKLEGLGEVDILSASGAQGSFSKASEVRISVEIAY